MAVAPSGTATPIKSDAGVTVLTIVNHTVPAGASLVVTVGAADWSSAPVIASIAWNGTESLSAVAGTSVAPTIDSAYGRIQHWVLQNPTAATANIVITFTAATYTCWAVAHNYTGVAAATSTEGGNPSTGTSGTSFTLAPTTTTVAGDYLCGAYWYGNGAQNVTTSDTSVYNDFANNLGGYWSVLNDASTGSGEVGNWSMASGATYGASVFMLKAAGGTAPTISNISDTTPTHGQSITITGTNFDATQGTNTVVIGGVTQTATAWSSTSITVTFNQGLNKHGVALSTVITASGGQVTNNSITGAVPAGDNEFVNLTSVEATVAYRLDSTPTDLAIGDQIEWDDPLVNVSAAGIPDGPSSVTSFQARIWKSGIGYGAWGTLTITQGHSVTIANSQQANQCTGCSIGQAHNVTAAASIQANQCSAGAIGQSHLIIPADSQQPNQCSAGAILQEAAPGYITVDSCIQANQCSAGAISQTHFILVTSSQQSNVASDASILIDTNISHLPWDIHQPPNNSRSGFVQVAQVDRPPNATWITHVRP